MLVCDIRIESKARALRPNEQAGQQWHIDTQEPRMLGLTAQYHINNWTATFESRAAEDVCWLTIPPFYLSHYPWHHTVEVNQQNLWKFVIHDCSWSLMLRNIDVVAYYIHMLRILTEYWSTYHSDCYQFAWPNRSVFALQRYHVYLHTFGHTTTSFQSKVNRGGLEFIMSDLNGPDEVENTVPETKVLAIASHVVYG